MIKIIFLLTVIKTLGANSNYFNFSKEEWQDFLNKQGVSRSGNPYLKQVPNSFTTAVPLWAQKKSVTPPPFPLIDDDSEGLDYGDYDDYIDYSLDYSTASSPIGNLKHGSIKFAVYSQPD